MARSEQLAGTALQFMGTRLREFPDGYEARVVHEPRAGRQHWVLLNPLKWVEQEMVREGWVPVDAQEVERMERERKAQRRAQRKARRIT